MGLRGPPPKPSALKEQQGTWRADRAVANEMKPETGTPICPEHLDEVARAEWSRVVPELERLGVLTVVDGAGLEAYCANYSMAVRLSKIASAAPLLKTEKGLRVNPASGEARRYWTLVKQFAAEFGLTPASRTRVGTPTDGDKADPVGDFLFGGLKAIPGGK